MYTVKQSTALTIPIFVHDVNGDAVTGLVSGGFTKRISKGSAAFGAMTVTITEMENGWYSVPVSTSHSDTLGLLSITFTHGSSKQVNLQFRVEAKLTDTLQDLTAANVNTEADNAIVTYGLDHLVSAAVVGADVADNSIIAQLADDAATADWDNYDNTTASLEALNVDTDAIKAETVLIVADTGELQADDIPGSLTTLQTAVDALTDPYGIQKNTNFLNFEFPMVLASDHYTAATSKSVTGEMSLDGAAFTGIASTIAEVGSGLYNIGTLLAADVNADTVTFKFSATACDDSLITIITRT